MPHIRLWRDTICGIATTAPREHFDLLRQDVRYGLRNLRRSPGLTVVAVAALAVGIGANSAVFSIVNGVLLEPLAYRDPQCLVTMFEKVPDAPVEKFGFSAPDFEIVRPLTQSFSGMAAYRNTSYELSTTERSERVVATRVSPELFGVLGVEPIVGRGFTAEDNATNAKVAILSDGLFNRAFARDPHVIGRTIPLDRELFTIIGVMPPSFAFPPRGSVLNGEPAALYVPIAFTPFERRAFGSMYNNSVVARLKPGATLDQARADLARAAQELARQYPAALRGLGESLTFPFGPLDEEVVGKSRRLLLVLMGAVGLVLLIGCADVATLMLTRASGRQRELAIRSALGASAARVVRQLVTEGVVLASLSGAVGVGLAYVTMRGFLSLAGDSLPRLESIRFDGRVIGFTAALALATPLIFGVIPALRIALRSTSDTLKEGTRGTTPGRGRQRLVGALVVVQFALALMLSVGAGLLLQTFARLLDTDPGFRAEHAVNVTMTLPAGHYPKGIEVKAFYEQLIAATRAIPGVTFAGAATDRPLNVRDLRAFTPDASAGPVPALNRVTANTFTVGSYFDALGIPLKRGRLFTDADGRGQPVVIVNEILARKLWLNQDPIGRQIKWGPDSSESPWMTVIGVVGDVKQGAIGSEIIAQTYEPIVQAVPDTLGGRIVRFFGDVNLAARSDRPADSLIADVRIGVARLDPMLAVSQAQAVAAIVGESVKPQRFSMVVASIFAALALVLATIGIYGVLASAVSQQTQEIAVRMALGASVFTVLWFVIRRALVLMSAGVCLGLAGAMALTGVLTGLLYEVRATDAATFAGAALLLAGLALVAALLPAWRATRVDPLVALRMD